MRHLPALLPCSLWLAACVLSAQNTRSEQKREPQKNQNKPTPIGKLTVSPSATTPSNVSQPAASYSAQYSSQEQPQWKQISDTLASWGLVLVGAIGARIAIRSLKEIEQQVRANQASAHAALRQANAARHQTRVAIHSTRLAEKALLLTERADLLIDRCSQDQPGYFGRETKITVIFKNFGRTRANNILVKMKIGISDSVEKYGNKSLDTPALE